MTAPGSGPVLLRRLLAEEPAPWPVWRDAAHHAAHRLGADVAERIRWAEEHDEHDRITGELVGADATLRLRFEQSEPGAELLQVQVRCSTDPWCEQAWDSVYHRTELLRVLDGGDADGDPQCDVHDTD